jgi:hypothetical protein
LRFDDEGVGHQVYDFISEADFSAMGPADELKRQFVEESAQNLQNVDERDREVALEKRRKKRLKAAGVEIE